MKEIKVYETELAEYLENKIEGLSFIVSEKGHCVANVLDEYYNEHEKDIAEAVYKTGYGPWDYCVKTIEI